MRLKIVWKNCPSKGADLACRTMFERMGAMVMNVGALASQAPSLARAFQERRILSPLRIDETVKVRSVDMTKPPKPIGWDTGEIDARIAEGVRIMKEALVGVAGWNSVSPPDPQRGVSSYAAVQRADRLQR